jgi:glycosyltransferase involved in cell wall biosynthesis
MGQSDPPRHYSILSIAPTSFFYDYGCHVRILEETLALQTLGHQVSICTYYSGNDVAGVDIFRSAPIPWRTGVEVGSSRHKIAFDLLLSAIVLVRALRRRPDVIHAHLHEGALIGAGVGRLLRIPVVFDFQGSLTAEMVDHRFLRAGDAFYRFWRRMERLIDHLPAAIIASSACALPLLTSEFGCRPDMISIVPDVAKTEDFRPRWRAGSGYDDGELMALRQRLGIPATHKVVVYLGLLAEYQGTDLLVQAAAQVVRQQPATHFLIMGFPNVEGYAQKAQDLGIAANVSFPGRIPYQQTPLYLALGDVAVSPKLSATEGAGKLLNYMAMGLPVVSFDTPVAREYLGDAGVYAPLGDAGAFAAQLLALLADVPRRRALAVTLRQRAELDFSWQKMGERIAAVYDKVVRR